MAWGEPAGRNENHRNCVKGKRADCQSAAGFQPAPQEVALQLGGGNSLGFMYLQIGAQLVDGGFRGYSVLCAQSIDLAVLDELVGPSDAYDRSRESCVAELLEDCAAESACEDVVFHGKDDVHASGVELQHLDIDWLGETGIDDGRLDAFTFEFESDITSHGHQRSNRKDSDSVILAVL
jgi:hypothetical protein